MASASGKGTAVSCGPHPPLPPLSSVPPGLLASSPLPDLPRSAASTGCAPSGSVYSSRSRKSSAGRPGGPSRRQVSLHACPQLLCLPPCPTPPAPTCFPQFFQGVLQAVLLCRPQPLLGSWQPLLSHLCRDCEATAISHPWGCVGSTGASTCLPPPQFLKGLQLLPHVSPIQDLHVCAQRPREGLRTLPSPPQPTQHLGVPG